MPRILLAALAGFLSAALAVTSTNDGQPDPGFGTSGETSLDILSGETPSGNGLGVVAVGGKIVIAGTGSVPQASSTLAIARLLDDGSPDTTFGNLDGQPGRSAIDLTADGLDFFYYAGLAASSDGTGYYLGGTSYLTNYVGVVLRIDGSGHLDTGFAGKGYVAFDLGNGGDPHSLFARAVTPTQGGGVVVGGEDYTVSTPASLYLVRFLADGTQDPSFNNNTGVLYIAPPADSQGLRIVDMKTGAQGDVYLGINYSLAAGGSRMAIAHVKPDGTLDTAFADNATFAMVDYGLAGPSHYDYPMHIAIEPTGKVLIAGQTEADEAPQGRCGIARFNRDGTPDAGFGVNGVQNYGAFSGCNDIAVQGNRRIIVAGNVNGTSSAAFAQGIDIANGSIDTSFGTDGMASFSSNPVINALTIDELHRPVLAGAPSQPGFYAARLTADGIYVDGFDGN
jgi:uncharacterized delta-60 repeat protein